MADQVSSNMLSLTAEVVAAYVTKNSVPRTALSEVIAQVHSSFQALSVKRHPKLTLDRHPILTPLV